MPLPSSLRIAFAGTPPFAASILDALLNAGHDIIAVYTQPDRPAGRGRHLQESAVKTRAIAQGIPVYQPTTLKDAMAQDTFSALGADLFIVVAYGLILPAAILAATPLGAFNVHGSLLPRWRGAAPIQRCLLEGDETTGVTIMQMDEGLDTGPMLLQKSCTVSSQDTSASLYERLALLGAQALLETLTLLKQNALTPIAQPAMGVTYASKLVKSEAALDWTEAAVVLDRKIRAFNPWPVAHSYLGEERIQIWQARSLPDVKSTAIPGTLIAVSPEGVDVATGEGVLRLEVLQCPGGRPLPIVSLLNGRSGLLASGQRFTVKETHS